MRIRWSWMSSTRCCSPRFPSCEPNTRPNSYNAPWCLTQPHSLDAESPFLQTRISTNREKLDAHLQETELELCMTCAPAAAEGEDGATAEGADGEQAPTTQPEAELIRRFAERPRENFFEVKCMVSRIGEMVRASAPGFGVKALIDPLPGYHWSVCIRRNYQSAKEHKVSSARLSGGLSTASACCRLSTDFSRTIPRCWTITLTRSCRTSLLPHPFLMGVQRC